MKPCNPDHGREPWECPRCKETVTCYPATSRFDSVTEICSNCGTEQALLDFYWMKKMNAKFTSDTSQPS